MEAAAVAQRILLRLGYRRGGAHHTVFSYNVTAEQLIDWAEMVGMESVLIDKHTNPLAFRNELRLSDTAWRLR